jgi:methyl-accepting chemotaxis protein
MARNGISRFSILQQIVFFGLVASAGFILFSVTAFSVIGKVKITGPSYRQIIQDKDLVADILPPPEYIIESYLVTHQAIAESDQGRQRQLFERFGKLENDYNDRHAYWQKELAAGEMKDLMVDASYAPAREFFAVARNEFFPALFRGDTKQAEAMLKGKLRNSYEAHRQQIDRLVALADTHGRSIETETAGMLTRSTALMVIVCLTILVGCGIIGFLVIRSIAGTFATCTAITDEIAAGNLTLEVPIAGKGNVREMLGSLRTMVESFRGIIIQVTETANRLAASSEGLSDASRRIAESAGQAATQSATVAIAGGEMATTSRDISASCQTAVDSSQTTNHIATAGMETVRKTIGTMEGIAQRVNGLATTVGGLGQRSDQIGQIIGTIEDIADQTNLLALNAAIEAARAGEQGRGFAVVADEVRALAERTTRATREISEMIKVIQGETTAAVSAMEDGVRAVENGTGEAARSEGALQEILQQIEAVTVQINQIATAAEEQTATTTLISDNILQATRSVQGTASEANACAGEAASLAGLANGLQKAVSRFRVA